MKLVSTLLLCVSALAAQNTLSQKEISEGWILLFDGQTLFGWTQEGKRNGAWRTARLLPIPATPAGFVTTV